MSPYDEFILSLLRHLNRWAGGPVSTRLIACETGRPSRMVRYYMARLEGAGLVTRPAGVRSGWCVA